MRIAGSCLTSPSAELKGLLPPFGSEPFGAIIADSIRPAGVVVDAALLKEGSTRRQCLLITHERALLTLFQDVLQEGRIV